VRTTNRTDEEEPVFGRADREDRARISQNRVFLRHRKMYKISENTIYIWRRKYGGMEPNQVSEMKKLAQENACLKRLLAERALEIDVMKEVLGKKW